MTETYDNALSYSSQWLEIIKQENFPEEAQAKWIIDESNNNFAEHFNRRNWLEYRKSVTEAGDWASVEWSGKGSTFTDVLGRKYIDWLGGLRRSSWLRLQTEAFYITSSFYRHEFHLYWVFSI